MTVPVTAPFAGAGDPTSTLSTYGAPFSRGATVTVTTMLALLTPLNAVIVRVSVGCRAVLYRWALVGV